MVKTTQVIYYKTEKGESPISQFLDTLDKKQQAKIIRILSTIEEYGLMSILPHIKKLKGCPLWEIRVLGKDSIRVLYMKHYGDRVIILHGFIKKSNTTPNREIQIALRRMRHVNTRVDR